MSARVPAPDEQNEDERRRLERLRALRVLDTGAEPLFDSLAALASQVCGTPVALLSLIDADRQWFKANELPPVPVHLVYPAGRTAKAKVRLFVQFSAERLRQVEVLRGRGLEGPAKGRGREKRAV